MKVRISGENKPQLFLDEDSNLITKLISLFNKVVDAPLELYNHDHIYLSDTGRLSSVFNMQAFDTNTIGNELPLKILIFTVQEIIFYT